MQIPQAEVLEHAKQLREDLIEPNAARWEQEQRQPVGDLRKAISRGFGALDLDVEMGGSGISFTQKLQVCEELSKGSMPFTFSLINTGNIAVKMAHSGNPAHRAYLDPLISGELFGATALSEPGAGSDFAAIQTTGIKTRGGWLLNGSKGWITNAEIADLFVTYVQTDPGKGWKGIACFVVDARKDGFRRGEIYDVNGGRSIGAGEFHLNDFFVSEDDMLSPPGEAFKRVMELINGARAYVAAMCCGIMTACLEHAIDYGVERHSFGQPIIAHQGLRWSLVDVATDIEALRALTYQAGAKIDNGEDASLAAAYAKKLAGRVGVPAITACIQAMGANGLKQEFPLTRHLMSAKIAAFTDGSTEMMNERISAGLIKPKPNH
jgi:alkylation response protein AidB-like acyl-CoA dehydrogenase